MGSNQPSKLRRVPVFILLAVASQLGREASKRLGFILEERLFHRLLALMATQSIPFPDTGQHSHSCPLNYNWKRNILNLNESLGSY